MKWKCIVCLVAGTKQPHPIMGWGLFCTCKPRGNEEGRVVCPWAQHSLGKWGLFLSNSWVGPHSVTYALPVFTPLPGQICVSISWNLLFHRRGDVLLTPFTLSLSRALPSGSLSQHFHTFLRYIFYQFEFILILPWIRPFSSLWLSALPFGKTRTILIQSWGIRTIIGNCFRNVWCHVSINWWPKKRCLTIFNDIFESWESIPYYTVNVLIGICSSIHILWFNSLSPCTRKAVLRRKMKNPLRR